MTGAAQALFNGTWQQVAASVVLLGAVLTAVGAIWAKLFAGPVGRWVKTQIREEVGPDLDRLKMSQRVISTRVEQLLPNGGSTMRDEIQQIYEHNVPGAEQHDGRPR